MDHSIIQIQGMANFSLVILPWPLPEQEGFPFGGLVIEGHRPYGQKRSRSNSDERTLGSGTEKDKKHRERRKKKKNSTKTCMCCTVRQRHHDIRDAFSPKTTTGSSPATPIMLVIPSSCASSHNEIVELHSGLPLQRVWNEPGTMPVSLPFPADQVLPSPVWRLQVPQLFTRQDRKALRRAPVPRAGRNVKA